MTPSRLRKLRQEIAKLRAGSPNVGQLQRLARKLGRKLAKRGKEPTWVNPELPDRRPISIPAHSSILRPTAQGIVDDLEGDLFAWEQRLDSEEKSQRGGKNDGKKRKAGSQKALRQNSNP